MARWKADVEFLLSVIELLFMAALCNRAVHYIFALWLWPPYVIGEPLYFCPVVSFFYLLLLLLIYSSPNLSGRRLDVYHTSTHGVALLQI